MNYYFTGMLIILLVLMALFLEVSMPIKNMIGIVVAVAMGVFAYTEVTARLTVIRNIKRIISSRLT